MPFRIDRTLAAALLTGAAVLAPCAAWYVAGSREAAREAAAIEDAPRRAAREAALRLAERLGGRLESLRQNEARRPFYHYQNLYHDPKGASEGASVVPSPLASGPSDPLVRAHFQIDPAGRVTLPTINEEVPELNAPDDPDGQVALRMQLAAAAKDCIAALHRPAPAPPGRTEPAPAIPSPASDGTAPRTPRDDPPDATQVSKLDPQAWSLNADSNRVYQTIQARKGAANPAANGLAAEPRSQFTQAPPFTGADSSALFAPAGDAANPAASGLTRQSQSTYDLAANGPPPALDPSANIFGGAYAKPAAAGPVAGPAGSMLFNDSLYVRLDRETWDLSFPDLRQFPDNALSLSGGGGNLALSLTGNATDTRLPAQAAAADGEVVIRIGPFAWRTVAVGGAPALVALRDVATPKGRLVQGFLVSPPAAADWLRGSALPVVFRPGDAAGEGEARVPVSGAAWRVAVDAGPALDRARTDARAVRSRFRRTFAWGASAALLAGACVVALVRQSERLARRRSQFAASAAHELRTPLAGLRLYGDMLAEGLGDPARSRDYARRIADEAGRLGRVVANVLGFTRLERGSLAVHLETGDLGAAVREAVERQRPTLEAAGARVELAIEDGLPPARFDRDAVGQIVHNLLDNAEKYSRAAEKRIIVVKVSKVQGPNGDFHAPDPGPGILDHLALTVSDRGPGVAAEARRRLFQAFERGGDPDAPAGLGLGLALTRALARAQGGDVAYRNAPGGGAEFSVRWPAGALTR